MVLKTIYSIVCAKADDPQVWELYWTKGQVTARSHPNFVAVSNALNKIWHASDETAIDLSTNVTYCDRLRIRQPGDTSFALGEHVDGGSVERKLKHIETWKYGACTERISIGWEDAEYRKCYQDILNGEWEKYDPFDATHRVDAVMDMYNCSGKLNLEESIRNLQ